MTISRFEPVLDLELIIPTPQNPRRFRDNEAFRSLVDSVKSMGVLEPILVRPHPTNDGMFDLRAGERRFRAAKEAGQKTIPAIIRVMDDREALEVTVTENLQREDLHPIEEGSGVAALLAGGWTAEMVANQLGKSEKWVLRRASLQDLNERWKKAAFDPKNAVSGWSASHLEAIGRLPSSTQDVLFEELGEGQDEFITLSDVRRAISEITMQLSSVPWKVKDEALLPKAGACLQCLKRSGAQHSLFDDEDFVDGFGNKAIKGDRCLDRACYEQKMEAYIKRREADLRGEHPQLLLLSDNSEGVIRNDKRLVQRGVQSAWEYHRTNKGDANALAALFIDGRRAGEFSWVEPSSLGMVKKAKRLTPEEKKERPAAEILKERKAALADTRTRMIADWVVDILDGEGDAPKIEVHALDEDPRGGHPHISHLHAVALMDAFGMQHADCNTWTARAWEDFEKRKERPLLDSISAALLHTRRVLAIRLRRITHPKDLVKETERICVVFHIDLAALKERAVKEKPDPKSWKALEERAKTERDSAKAAKDGASTPGKKKRTAAAAK